MTPETHLEALRPLIDLPPDVAWEDIVQKYCLGLLSHEGEPKLWEMDTERLGKEIKDEQIDLMIYSAEQLRRINETQEAKV